jgi:cysteine desulfurase
MAVNVRIRVLRDRLWERLQDGLGETVVLQGHPELRLPNTLNVAFRGRRGSDVLAACPGLAASTGAACHGGDTQLSDTLRAMGVAPEVGAGTVRLSLGRHTTEAEVDAAAEMLIAACRGK